MNAAITGAITGALTGPITGAVTGPITGAVTGPIANAAPAAASVGQTLLGLLLVLATIFALAWVVRRMQSVRVQRSGCLQLKAGLQVGTKERVLWLQAGDTQLLVGVAPGSVRTLHVFSGNTSVPLDPAISEERVQSAAAPTFSEVLRKLLHGEGRA